MSEVEGGLVIGQSNAGYVHGEPGGPLIAKFDDSADLYMLSGQIGGSIGTDSPISFTKDIEAYREPIGAGQTPAGMIGFASHLLDVQFDRQTRMIALHSSFRGDCPLSDMLPGGKFHIYENAVNSQVALRDAFAKLGRFYKLKWIDVIQGEAGPFSGYTDMFIEYVRNCIPSISQHIGQDDVPTVFFSQINSFTNAVECNPVALQQVSAARKLLGDKAFLAGPMYYMPFHDPGHLTDIARMMHGEVRALVLQRTVHEKLSWNPLWPLIEHGFLNGNRISIEMELPPGAQFIAFDKDWIPKVRDQGFNIRNSAGEYLPIKNITIDTNIIHIDLECCPEGCGIIEYATFNDPGVKWWASGRGHLFAETGIKSPFAARGFDIPDTIRHYCVSFSIPFTQE